MTLKKTFSYIQAELKVSIVEFLKTFELLQRYKYQGTISLQVQYENTRIKVYSGPTRPFSAFVTPYRSDFVLN